MSISIEDISVHNCYLCFFFLLTLDSSCILSIFSGYTRWFLCCRLLSGIFGYFTLIFLSLISIFSQQQINTFFFCFIIYDTYWVFPRDRLCLLILHNHRNKNESSLYLRESFILFYVERVVENEWRRWNENLYTIRNKLKRKISVTKIMYWNCAYRVKLSLISIQLAIIFSHLPCSGLCH
jgi:hypothetical protein